VSRVSPAERACSREITPAWRATMLSMDIPDIDGQHGPAVPDVRQQVAIGNGSGPRRAEHDRRTGTTDRT
jgi:hypothetical protein